jgi:hypothetical protein
MLSTPDIAMRRVLAAVLGAVIGFDRERHTWGGRTARPHPGAQSVSLDVALRGS